jgi:lipopolysaccharide biosynthesis glycosyltransferase
VTTAVFEPNKTSFAIMKLVNGYFCKTRKPWTLMSQVWILEKLDAWHGIKIARSTLNYNLKILREQGLIETVTRHKRDQVSGEFVCRVTLYKAAKKLRKFFARLATYFKRCSWIPDIKSLRQGAVPVVGAATTQVEVFDKYVEEVRRRRKKK